VLENHHADVNVYDTNTERANHGRCLLRHGQVMAVIS
jgi:hypothetical protein